MRALALATRLPSDWRWTLAAVAPRDVIGLDACPIVPALARADT